MHIPHLKESGESQAAGAVCGPRVAGYTLLKKLSESSVCSIYKARQDRLGRIVALKLLPEFPPPCDVALERFNRAAYVGAQLVHANLPVLYETGTADGYYFAALEYVHGRSLQDVLAERERVSERRAIVIGLQTARALAALHEKGIAHRNLKPKNMLVDDEGRVRVIGLGLAKCEAACFSKNLDTQTIGTPHYMAPEMIRGNCTDPRSDLYSLGVTLYVMVAGQPPFAKGIPAAVMAMHLYEQARPLHECRPDLSRDFVTLVEELMAKPLESRLGSAREAVRRLERLAALQAREIPAALASPPRGPALWPAAKFERLWGTAAIFLGSLLAVFLLGMALFGAYLWLTTKPVTPVAPQPPAGANALQMEAAPAPDRLGAPLAPGVVSTPQGQAEARAIPEQELEFVRLKELDEVFRRDPARGVREWETYLRAFPRVSASQRKHLQDRIRLFRQMDADRRNKGLPPADMDGAPMDF